MPFDNEIRIEYDEEIQSYYVIWRPVTTMGMGQTEKEALEELKEAAYFGIDTLVDIKLAEICCKEEVKNGKQG